MLHPQDQKPSRPLALLVDDSQEHLDLHALMLEDEAIVITVSRGEDALVMAGGEGPVAIILDVMCRALTAGASARRAQ